MDSGNSGFIVAIDDDLHILAYLKNLLSPKGYSVLTFDKSRTALEYLKSNRPELILLDVSIPEIDGFEICKIIKANPELAIVPVIFITSGIEFNIRIEALNLGAVDFITKPFQKEELLARVDTHIRFHRLTELVKSQSVEIAESRVLKDLNKELLQKNKEYSELNLEYLAINEKLNVLNQELIETKTLLEQTLNQCPVPMVLVGMPGAKIRVLNPAAIEFLGISDCSSCLGANLFEITGSWQDFDKDGNPGKIEEIPLAKALKGEFTFHEERKIIRKDGSPRWGKISGLPIYNLNGEIIAGYMIVNDNTKIKQAEDEIAEKQKFLKIISDSVPDIIYLYSLDQMRYLYINKDLLSILGYSELDNKNLGSNIFVENIHPDDIHLVHAHVKNISTTGLNDFYQIECRVKRKNGDYYWFYIREKVYQRDSNGIPERIFGVCQDITEKKIAEEELIRAKERAERSEVDYKIALLDLNKAQSYAKIGSWKWYLQEERSEWSQEMYHIFEIDPKTSNSRLSGIALEKVYPEDRGKINELAKSAIERGKFTPLEYRIMQANGQLKSLWAEAGELIVDEYYKPLILSGIVQDITERKNVEQKLHESEVQYKLAFKTSADAIAIAKMNGEYVDVNEGFTEMLGYLKEEVVGKSSVMLNIWAYPEERDRFIAKLIKEHKVDNLEVINNRKDGNSITILLSANIIMLDGEPHIFSISRDISERKMFEEVLKEKEEKYRFLAENIQDIIWILDVETMFFTYVSPSVEKMRGFTVDEVMMQSFPDALTSDSREYLAQILPSRLGLKLNSEEDLVFVDELEQTCKDGSTVWTEVVTCYRVNSFGKVEILGTSRDISDRKKTEIALKESEDKFSKAFYSSPACMILAYISSATIIDVNDQVLHLLGYERNEIVGHTTIELNLWIDWGQRIDYLHQVSHNIPVDNEEVLFRAKSGKILYTRYSAQKIRLGDEDCILGVFVDITERKNMELELIKAKELAEENAKRVSSMFSTANTGFVVIDPSGRLVEWNNTFINYFGYSEEEFVKFFSNDITHPEDVAISFEQLDKLRTGQIDDFRIEKRFIRKDGSVFWADLFASSLKKDQNIYALLAVVNDITERKKFEFELISAKEKAEESDKLKSAFLQNMSHEIRTPMNAIMGFSGMLAKPGLSDEKRKGYSSIIMNSSKQLLSIVTDILTISSLETKQEKLNIEAVCINSMIIDLLAIFKPQASSQNISLYSKQYLTDKKSEIFTDKTKITQILTNLLTNALKFTQEGFVEFGYTIAVTLDGTFLQFYVRDTGIGIKQEQQEKIFERFRQADISINKKYGGTGLGLSISKGFAELLGGHIWVESESEKGSTFFFTVPYKPVDSEGQDLELITPKKKFTLLIAEDEEYNYLLIEELLHEMDIAIVHAKNGIDAIEMCEVNPGIDLILMDIKMPMLDGYKAAEIIKGFRPDLPVIAQSAYALEHEIEKYKGVFDAYVTKPIDSEELISAIKEYFGTI
jgi:PAS domain S-box-containing protein